MNYPITSRYRELYSNFDSFFKEVSLTFGRSFAREVKREALADYSSGIDMLVLNEAELLARVRAKHPEIERNMDVQTRIVLGAAA